MEFIVTAHAEKFSTVEDAQSYAESLVRDTGQDHYVLPVEGRMSGLKLSHVGILVTDEVGNALPSQRRAKLARSLAIDVRTGRISRPLAVRIYRDAYGVSLAGCLLAIDMEIGKLNGGEDTDFE